MSTNANPSDDELSFDLDAFAPAKADAAATPLVALDLIALISWHKAGGLRLIQRLKRSQAIVLKIPSESWFAPIKAIIDRERTGAVVLEGKRKADKRPNDVFIGEILQDGRSVVGIAVDSAQLPPLLVATADAEFVIAALSPALVRRAVAGFYRKRCPVVATADIAGLDLIEIAAAMRPDATPQSCLKRLARTSARKATPGLVEDTPLLGELSGYGEAKAWCLDLVAALDEARTGAISYGEIESGIFYGPPGTGKTLLARSVARTARIAHIETSVAEWFMRKSGHLGDVIQQIDEVFARALAQAPSVLFLDEIDALPDRAATDARSREWWASVVTTLLTRIDSCRAARRGVVLLAATNHVDHLDEALKRPGRFDRKFYIGAPDAAGLAAILRAHLKGDLAGVDFLPLARLMPGATGADVTAIVKAARRLARGAGRPLDVADLRRAILPLDGRSEAERRHVAIHEAGHAAVALAVGCDVAQVSIRGRGRAGGATDLVIPQVATLADLEHRVLVLLAGRAANLKSGAAPDTGASGDLSEATRLLTAAQSSFGLHGSLVVRSSPEAALSLVARDPTLAETIDARLQILMQRAEALVAQEWQLIEAIADVLLRQQVLDRQQLATMVNCGSRMVDELGCPAMSSAATVRV